MKLVKKAYRSSSSVIVSSLDLDDTGRVVTRQSVTDKVSLEKMSLNENVTGQIVVSRSKTPQREIKIL